ncbi:thioredoxin domain-containing protein [Candidatus Saccharibacteria bacterium]|nr:thioredoxin domain-containing protein [Candidatus Saccharibacteria bacterium]
MQKAIRVIAIIIVVGFLGSLMFFNIANPAPPDMTAWNEAMTMGDKNTAKHHFVMYTDLFCPYCDKFSDALTANKDDFIEKYINGRKILFEIRMTDMNYAFGHSNNSRPAGEGAYCAARQGKFWEYYESLLGKLYEDYHSKGIGVDRDSEKIPDLEMAYFYEAGRKAQLDEEKFISCLDNHEAAEELDKNTERAQQIVPGGVPYFVFDKFTENGFLGNWNADEDYKQAKLLLDAGLNS